MKFWKRVIFPRSQRVFGVYKSGENPEITLALSRFSTIRVRNPLYKAGGIHYNAVHDGQRLCFCCGKRACLVKIEKSAEGDPFFTIPAPRSELRKVKARQCGGKKRASLRSAGANAVCFESSVVPDGFPPLSGRAVWRVFGAAAGKRMEVPCGKQVVPRPFALWRRVFCFINRCGGKPRNDRLIYAKKKECRGLWLATKR